MSSRLRRLARLTVEALPGREALEAACRLYLDRRRGENDSDPRTNGEAVLLRRVAPRCGTVLDVGASVGDWAALVLSINPQVQLYCFEPSREAFERLIRRGLSGTVRIENVGLGANAGRARLYGGSGSPLASVYRREGLSIESVPGEAPEEVGIDTLDSYCQRHDIERIDLLKLDVEGHELAVLEGASGLLEQRRIGIVQFEYGGANIDARVLLRDLWEMLERRGFSLFKLYPGGPVRVARYSQAHENFQLQNWVAVLDVSAWPGLEL
jgi:FkbM family methyltransferase